MYRSSKYTTSVLRCWRMPVTFSAPKSFRYANLFDVAGFSSLQRRAPTYRCTSILSLHTTAACGLE